MSEHAQPDEWPDDDEYPGDPDEQECFHCGGEGTVECDNWLQCTRAHTVVPGNDDGGPWQFCKCSSCGGSGLAKDMTIW